MFLFGRGVNVGAEYYRDFDYLGVRIEDTPQTQISRYTDGFRKKCAVKDCIAK